MKYYVLYVCERGDNVSRKDPLYDPCCAVTIGGDSIDEAKANFSRIFMSCFGDSLRSKIVAIIPEGSNATIYADPYNGVVV